MVGPLFKTLSSPDLGVEITRKISIMLNNHQHLEKETSLIKIM
jgi:hypothetical protein